MRTPSFITMTLLFLAAPAAAVAQDCGPAGAGEACYSACNTGCYSGDGSGCSQCDCKGPSKWKLCKHTLHHAFKCRCDCDLIPHYAYYPEYHGYYYFLPYNHMHLAQHIGYAMSWGGSATSPYAEPHFTSIYEAHESEDDRKLLGLVPRLPPFEETPLPDLESLLAQ